MKTGVYVVLAVAIFGIVKAELSDAELKEAVIGTSIDMFKAVTSEDLKNRVVSPVGAGIMLALLEQGTREQSSQQLQTALRLSHDQLTEGYSRIVKKLKAEKPPGLQLESATRIFVSENVPVLPEYQKVAEEHFLSGVGEAAFGSQNASRIINSWAYKATDGKIASIVDSVSPSTTSVLLANAMYFKSPWLNQFKATDTEKESFSVEPNRNVTVNQMYQLRTLRIGSNEQLRVKWIHLPFKGGKYFLLVVLPDKKFGLADAIDEMTSSDFKQMLNEGQAAPVKLYLPRFRFSSSIKLSQTFKKLGVTDVFDDTSANLSGISEGSSLKVAECFQKATIDIGEYGGDSSTSSGDRIASNDLPREFRVDHPFLAVIAETGGVPLFMSTVINPTSG